MAKRKSQQQLATPEAKHAKADDVSSTASEDGPSKEVVSGDVATTPASPTKRTKFVLVTGGVLSGIGKGVTASSIGALLKSHGCKVTAIKIDPYLNIDAGCLSPFEHGEVYVLDDGGEVDLDLGNYERLMDITLSREHNITTGKVYRTVIDRERRGDYLGKTVQVVPHITDEIVGIIERVSKIPTDKSDEQPDVCVIELGGTVGDIEGMCFVEALRQLEQKCGPERYTHFHVSLVPEINGQHKTKPTQHSVKDLRSAGISPDVMVCRCTTSIPDDALRKIAFTCNLPRSNVLNMFNVRNMYNVPLMMEEQGVYDILAKRMNLSPVSAPKQSIATRYWRQLRDRVDRINSDGKKVSIAVVGKYTDEQDAYLSVVRSLEHAAIAANRVLEIVWIESTSLEGATMFGVSGEDDAVIEKRKQAWKSLQGCDGLLIPGGFGDRGIQGKIQAVNWARTSGMPFLGVCLGMQCAVIEFARNVAGMKDANSEEFDPDAEHKVLVFMPEVSRTHMGGTMRLGARKTIFQENERHRSTVCRLYGSVPEIMERHRHRYEVNPDVVDSLEKLGLKFVGRDETGKRMEVIELEGHPYFVGCQYHPEYLTRPSYASPPFLGLLLAASGQLQRHFDTHIVTA